MPKFPIVNSKKLISFLKSLGFVLDHSTGSHFIFYNSQTKRRAVVPCHNKDILTGTVISILSEAGISKEAFKNFLKNKHGSQTKRTARRSIDRRAEFVLFGPEFVW